VDDARPADAPTGDVQSSGARAADPRSADTRRKLMDGAIETLRVRGIAGASARAIAAA